MKGVKKPNDTIAQHHMLFFITRQFVLLFLSKDQTLSRLWPASCRRHERYDLNVNFQASDSRDKFFMERCLCGSWTRHHMAFG